MILLRDIAVSYLIVTLAATGLAKLRRWRIASVPLVRDAVIPSVIVPGVVIAISLFELALAILLATGLERFFSEVAAAALLATFGIYRMIAAAHAKVLNCGCAGAVRSNRRTVQTVSATALSSAGQVAIALFLVATGIQYGGQWSAIVRMSALLVPFIALVIGHARGLGFPSVTRAHGNVRAITATDAMATRRIIGDGDGRPHAAPTA